jgi:uncharacterized protein YbjT (DUF2867 family)
MRSAFTLDNTHPPDTIHNRCALEGLLAAGLAPSQLVAVSRNPSSPAASAVAARGVQVAAADLDSPDSMRPLLAAARFVYVHALSGDAASADPLELRRGAALAALLAERRQGLGLAVYNSSAGRGADSGISQVEQKHQVADGLMAAGPPFMSLEATMFMEEFYKK